MVRLLEERCSRCHGEANIAGIEAGRLGWQRIIFRMQWINGATLLPGERDVLAEHLADVRPAGSFHVLAEYASAGVMLLVSLSAIVAGLVRAFGAPMVGKRSELGVARRRSASTWHDRRGDDMECPNGHG